MAIRGSMTIARRLLALSHPNLRRSLPTLDGATIAASFGGTVPIRSKAVSRHSNSARSRSPLLYGCRVRVVAILSGKPTTRQGFRVLRHQAGTGVRIRDDWPWLGIGGAGVCRLCGIGLPRLVFLIFRFKDSVCSLVPSVGEVRKELRRHVRNVLPRQSISGTEQSWAGVVTTAPTSLASRNWW